MSETEGELEILSRSVVESAEQMAFALMKANYSETNGPGPSERRTGATSLNRDVAIRFRESIIYRFDALGLHHEMMRKVHAGFTDALIRGGPLGARDGTSVRLGRAAALREQSLFDDLVFHSISLFDYLGNAIWFGFHGHNFVRKKWKGACRAARDPAFEHRATHGHVRINGSATGDLVGRVDHEFVGQLAEYRAGLFHYEMDSAGGAVSHKFSIIPGGAGRVDWAPKLEIRLPKDYMRCVKALVDDGGDDSDVPLLSGAESLIKRVGDSTLQLLRSLTSDLGWDKAEGLKLIP